MKKLTAISFLFIFLSANTVFGELLKLPVLVQHYLAHEANEADNDHDMCFVDFIKEHYSNSKDDVQKQGHEHSNLPFKCVSFHTLNHVVSIPQHNIISTDIPAGTFASLKIAFNPDTDYSSASLGSVWQPPRLS